MAPLHTGIEERNNKNIIICLAWQSLSHKTGYKQYGKIQTIKINLESQDVRQASTGTSGHGSTTHTGTEQGRKCLFNDALNTFCLRIYGVRHMEKDHSESERGNLLPPHGLLVPI